jgi:glycosyltransferase involved in cell wall biosynthesis
VLAGRPIPRPGPAYDPMSSLSRAVSISAVSRLSVCLFTDSLDPSGIGEHMITLAGQLRRHCQLSFVCPSSPAGKPFLDGAASLGVETFALNWQHNERYTGRHFVRWLRERGFDVFHGHAGIGWEGHAGIGAARRAGIPVVIRTEHLPYLLTNSRERAQHTRTCRRLDRLLCVSHESAASYLDARLPPDLVRVIHNGISAICSHRDRRDIRAGCGIPESGKIILTVARMTEQKG